MARNDHDVRTDPTNLGHVDLPSDREVKSTVVHRLRENPYTQDYRIKVSVHDGVVVLDGEVGSREVRSVAAEDAQVVPGVRQVANELEVRVAA